MKYLAIILALLLLLTGCSSVKTNQDITEEAEEMSEGTEAEKQQSTAPASSSDMFTKRDLDSSYKDAVKIELDGKTAKASSNTVKISDNTVTITEEADYLISGSYKGTIKVEADQKAKPHLVFDSVEVVSGDYAALYITEADKVTVTLVGDNSFESSGSFESRDQNNVDAAVFSKQDLSFNGTGSLRVESTVGHGIVCKDDLVFAGGSYSVYSASHGIDANDSIRITNSAFTVDSGKDAFHCENIEDTSKGFVYIENGSFSLECEGDGISSSAYMLITEGDFDITAGGGSANGTNKSSGGWGGFMGGYYGNSSSEDSESMKGLKSAGELTVNGGNFNINSADDSIHSNTAIEINEGNFELKSGDDGIHAEDSLVINKGNISIKESYEGLEAYEVTIKDGDISVYASDDGINAAGGNDQSGYGGRDNGGFGGPGGFGGMMGDNGGVISIEGGKVYLNAGGDAVDSNGELYIKGGEVITSGPTYGDTSILDFATEGVISGGSFIGCGSVGMDGCFDSTSTQGAMMLSISAEAKTSVILCDSEGNIILEHSPDQAFNCIILSHGDIKKGESYTLTVGTENYEITMNDIIYSQSGGGFGGPGGGFGGPGGGGMPYRPGR
ncbi:MAG: carbohydrate-binding domain-containing protein [Clostridia bacterium]|nr:carbohydrate-binding domain-containing protein [Clostridia bacterium]